MIPKKLQDEIEVWIRSKKYGCLQINFRKGVIVNVNRTESFKVEWTGAGRGPDADIQTQAPSENIDSCS